MCSVCKLAQYLHFTTSLNSRYLHIKTPHYMEMETELNPHQTVVMSITSNKHSDAPLRRITFNDTVDIANAVNWDRSIEHIWMRYKVCKRCSGITDAELNQYKRSEMDVHTASYDNTVFHRNYKNQTKERFVPYFPCPCPTCNNYDGREPPQYRLSRRTQGSDFLRTQCCYYCLPQKVCPNYKKRTAVEEENNDKRQQNYQSPEKK